MSRTTRITAPDGSVTKIQTKSSWGCLTLLAIVVVVFGPAAWFGVWAIPAYTALGLAVALFLAHAWRTARRSAPPD